MRATSSLLNSGHIGIRSTTLEALSRSGRLRHVIVTHKFCLASKTIVSYTAPCSFVYRPGDSPNAEWISDRIVSSLISVMLTDIDVDDVI